LAPYYRLFVESSFSIGPPGSALTLTVGSWLSEGLLAFFFLLVGLEIRLSPTGVPPSCRWSRLAAAWFARPRSVRRLTPAALPPAGRCLPPPTSPLFSAFLPCWANGCRWASGCSWQLLPSSTIFFRW